MVLTGVCLQLTVMLFKFFCIMEHSSVHSSCFYDTFVLFSSILVYGLFATVCLRDTIIFLILMIVPMSTSMNLKIYILNIEVYEYFERYSFIEFCFNIEKVVFSKALLNERKSKKSGAARSLSLPIQEMPASSELLSSQRSILVK